MQNAGDYYQRAPRCCPGRSGNTSNGGGNSNNSNCCSCSCSTATSAKRPGLLMCLGMCMLVLGYTLLGAFAFMALEGGFKSDSSTEVTSSKPDESGTYVLPNLENDSATMELRARTVEKLWSITEDLNVLYKENWTRLAAREVLEFQENLARGLNLKRTSSYDQVPISSRSHHADRRPHSRRWTFSGSLLYSLTLITTIGYGSVTPRTAWGRLITIVYALAGIPLLLVYLSTVGEVFARNFRRLYGRMCRRPREYTRNQQPPPPPPPPPGKAYRYDNHVETTKTTGNYYSASRESSCDDLGNRGTASAILLDCGSEGLLHATTSSTAALQDVTGNGQRHFHSCSLSLSSISSPANILEANRVRVPISLCLAIMLVYICGGAIMFNRLEGWNLIESGYFCFTGLVTIGFGDLIPTGRNAPTAILEELSLCACSLYILAGMGLIAMCFNLVQEEVVRVVRAFRRTCDMSSGVVVGPIGGTGVATPGLGVDDDGAGTSDSRLSEQEEEEAIAMSMVPAGS